jgi:hypothetical protein
MERLSWIQKHTMILSNLVECLSPSLQPTITVPARGQVFNLTETAFGNFIVGGYVGSLRFLADSPIAVIGFDYWLNLGNLTSTREPFDEAMPTSGATLPHLPSGFQGYQTRIQILRTSDTQATKGVIRFFSETGDPVDPQTLLQ